jgi:hypothetical protein
MNAPFVAPVKNIGLIVGAVLCAVGVWRGIYLFRGGAIDERSTEYLQILTRVNMLNALAGMPPQQSLTEKQLRVAGVGYVVLGLLGLTACAFGMRSLSQ